MDGSKRTKRCFLPPGFTLIELISVLTIITILAAIAIPQYSKYVRKAVHTEVEQLLYAMASAERQYRARHDTFLSCGRNPASGSAWVKKDGWDLLDFDPAQPLYGYSFEIRSTKDTYRISAYQASQEMLYVTQDSYEVKQAAKP